MYQNAKSDPATNLPGGLALTLTERTGSRAGCLDPTSDTNVATLSANES